MLILPIKCPRPQRIEFCFALCDDNGTRPAGTLENVE